MRTGFVVAAAALLVLSGWAGRGGPASTPASVVREELAGRVRRELLHAWRGYERYAWGHVWYGQADMATGKRTATEYGALHAFLPAVLALGEDLRHAKRLEDSCFKMWTANGVEPEVLDYKTMKVASPGYQLRPEIMESAYYLYRYTKDPRYLEMGRTFFEALVAHCRTDAGYTNLKSVVTKEKGDLMPSYFLTETLKYLYLLFAPETTLDFDRVVFNTEAHPLRRT